MKILLSLVSVLLFSSFAFAQSATTYSAANVATTSVLLKGHVDPGSGTFYSVEFEWSVNSDFSGSSTHAADEGSTFTSPSDISYSLSGLNPNTVYFFRVIVGYSTATGGGITASSKNFTTTSATVPTVVIGNDFTNITNDAARNTDNDATADGGSDISDKGLVYATHTTPDISDNVLSVASGLGKYNGNLSGLSQLSHYYARAYATNSTGTGYSSEKSFYTLATTNAAIDSMVSPSSGKLTIYFNAGTGDGCMIYIRQGSSITDDPSHGTTYTANTSFGSGSDLGNSTYVVYDGGAKSNSVTVSNLDDSQNYYVKTASYGGSGSSTVYDKSASQQNTNDDSNLPVEFIAFSAFQYGQGVKLLWTTATETNNNYFAVERSIDNSQFFTIGKVQGAGNSNRLRNYMFQDEKLLQQVCYYRIKQVDFDGKDSYSKTVSLIPQTNMLEIALILQTDNQIQIQLKNHLYAIHFQLYDMAAKLIIDQYYSAKDRSIIIDRNKLAKGIYFIRIVDNNTSISRKILN